MNDSPGFNLIRKSDKERYKIGGIDKKRSFIDIANSYPKNIEIKSTLTYSANNLSRSNNSKTLSFQINHSIILLPKTLMQVRYSDKRIGWSNLKKIDYSSEKLKSDQYSIIRRWKLEPKNIILFEEISISISKISTIINFFYQKIIIKNIMMNLLL